MNLINGLEESPVAFAMVSGGSATTAIMVAGIYFSFIRGRVMQERAEQRLSEIETFVRSLSDMDALDYTVKKMIQGEGRMNKTTFKERLIEARASHHASDEEVDFLFDVLDTQKDNHLTPNDFHHGDISTKT
jgi:hypothetical protein